MHCYNVLSAETGAWLLYYAAAVHVAANHGMDGWPKTHIPSVSMRISLNLKGLLQTPGATCLIIMLIYRGMGAHRADTLCICTIQYAFE